MFLSYKEVEIRAQSANKAADLSGDEGDIEGIA
jgi:hypothetical protein